MSNDSKMIGISPTLHQRIKILSAITGKKIYALIEEAIIWLEEKYINNE